MFRIRCSASRRGRSFIRLNRLDETRFAATGMRGDQTPTSVERPAAEETTADEAEDLEPEDDEFDPFADDVEDPPPEHEGDDRVHEGEQ